MSFGRKWKLSPRYVGPYKILLHVGEVAYESAVPVELDSVHPVFDVYPASILLFEGSGVDEDLSYDEVPILI